MHDDWNARELDLQDFRSGHSTPEWTGNWMNLTFSVWSKPTAIMWIISLSIQLCDIQNHYAIISQVHILQFDSLMNFKRKSFLYFNIFFCICYWRVIDWISLNGSVNSQTLRVEPHIFKFMSKSKFTFNIGSKNVRNVEKHSHKVWETAFYYLVFGRSEFFPNEDSLLAINLDLIHL